MKRDTYRSYQDKLKDPRWKTFCNRIYSQEKFQDRQQEGAWCEICESQEDLRPHHLGYRDHRDPWDYPMEEMMVVCETCHKEIHGHADDLWNEVLKCRNNWHIYEVLKAARQRLAELLDGEQAQSEGRQHDPRWL